jgi:hypothetical protein
MQDWSENQTGLGAEHSALNVFCSAASCVDCLFGVADGSAILLAALLCFTACAVLCCMHIA